MVWESGAWWAVEMNSDKGEHKICWERLKALISHGVKIVEIGKNGCLGLPPDSVTRGEEVQRS